MTYISMDDLNNTLISRNKFAIHGKAECPQDDGGAQLDTAAACKRVERGVYAASACLSAQTSRCAQAVRMLKRPEGRAPAALCGCAPVTCRRSSQGTVPAKSS